MGFQDSLKPNKLPLAIKHKSLFRIKIITEGKDN